MKIKNYRLPPTYNATPRRIERLAIHITDYLKAEQAKKQAKGLFFTIKKESVIDALEGFVDPHNFSSQ